MKFSLILVVALCAYAAAQDTATDAASDASEEGIFKIPKGFGDFVKKHLKDLAKDVGKTILSKTKDMITDCFKLKNSKEANAVLQAQPSSEGIFDAAADLILKKANEFAVEHEREGGPSHEGIVTHFGYIHKISEAEDLLHVKYNKTFTGENPSHEGILGGLGGFVINGIGDFIGGDAGKIMKIAGDVVGSLFFASPLAASQEDIIQEYSQEGIISSAGKVLLKGAAKLAAGLLKGVFGNADGLLGNIFMARGSFSGYPNIHAPANEILLEGRYRVKAHAEEHPKAVLCIESAEKNFTQLFDQYAKHSHACVTVGQKNSKKILDHVQDIVLDAVKRVEDAHRETGFCFEKDATDDRATCLDVDVPQQITEHRKKILHYGDVMADYVRQISDINTNFDVCLVGHLGVVRRDVYAIVNDFHNCVYHFNAKIVAA